MRNNRRMRMALTLVLILSLAILAGCKVEEGSITEPIATGSTNIQTETKGDSGTSQPVSEEDPDQELPRPEELFPEGASVARRTLGTTVSLDPLEMNFSQEEELARYLFGSLFILQGNKETGLPEYTAYHAESMPETSDHLLYSMELKTGVSWSDGTPITAMDYVDSLKMLLDPKLAHPAGQRFTASLPIIGAADYRSGAIQSFEEVGFRAVGDYTLEVRLESSRTPLDVAKAFSLPFLIKADLYNESLSDEGKKSTYGDNWEMLLYSGPYTLVGYEEGKSIRLEKRRDPVLESYDTEFFTSDFIWLRDISDRVEAFEEFKNGRLDVISIAGGFYSGLKDDPRYVEASSNTVWGLYVNTATGSKILKNPNFRQALYYGIDRTRIAVSIAGPHSSYSGFIGPLSMVQKPLIESGEGSETEAEAKDPIDWKLLVYGSTAQSRESVPKANVVDEKRAREYAETAMAGFTELQTIELVIPKGGQLGDMGAFLKQSIESLFGQDKIQVTIRELTQEESQAALIDGDYDLGFGGMGQDLFDPLASLAVYTTGYGEKFNTFRNTRFDELYEAGYRGAFFGVHSLYMAALQEMEEILLNELPMIPLFVNHGAWLVNPGLQLPFEEPISGAGLGLDRALRLD